MSWKGLRRGRESKPPGHSALGSDQTHVQHSGAGDAAGAPVQVQADELLVPLQQQAFPGGGCACPILEVHFHGKPPEAAEVPVIEEFLADAGAADLQNIGIAQQRAAVEGSTDHPTETGTFVEIDVAAVGTAHLDQQTERNAVALDLDVHHRKLGVSSLLVGQLPKFSDQGVGQRAGGVAVRGARPAPAENCP